MNKSYPKWMDVYHTSPSDTQVRYVLTEYRGKYIALACVTNEKELEELFSHKELDEEELIVWEFAKDIE